VLTSEGENFTNRQGLRKVKRIWGSYRPSPMAKRKIIPRNKQNTTDKTGDRKRIPKSPFGVMKGNQGIIVKTISKGDSANITLDSKCLEVIKKFAEENGITPHIIVKDENTGEWFHKEGAKDWSMRTMKKITDEKMRELF